LADSLNVVRITVSDNDPTSPLTDYVEVTITVTQEDARNNFTGDMFVSTGSGSTANVTLSATVRDITPAEPSTSPPNPDSYSGDIREARVKFVNRDTNTDIVGCTNLTPGLVNAADKTVGTVSCLTALTIGTSQDSVTMTVGIVVERWYSRSDAGENTLVTASRSMANFITGGGYITLTGNASGLCAGALGSKMNFGFNVKYNKSGTNLQGSLNAIVRSNTSCTPGYSGQRVYQIKSNSIQSLSTNNAGAYPYPATFTAKSNITDITNPNNPVLVSGSGGQLLKATMTDNGEPGSKPASLPDTIGLAVGGGTWFSSNWDGTTTIEQPITGGNLQVR